MNFLSGCFLGGRLALRARFLPVSSWLFVFVLLAAALAAQFSGRQPSTVALDVGISTIRLVLPLVIVLLAQELISREFERRYFLNTLSFPCTRARFLLQRFCVIVYLGQFLLLVLGAALALSVWLISTEYAQGTAVALGKHYWITISFISVELCVLAAMATLLSVIASTPSFVIIGTLGFMLAARSFASIVELLARNHYVVDDADRYGAGVSVLGYLLPDLGALDVRMIALYGRMEFLPSDWLWSVLSSVGYALCLLALAVWALNRKRFA